jgi:hypothetical protein
MIACGRRRVRSNICVLMPLPVGASTAPYEIESLFGTGAMRVVYRARETRLNPTLPQDPFR